MKPDLPQKPYRPSALRIVWYVILMGVVVWWAAFYVMPKAIAWEMAPSMQNRIPTVGFFLGAVLGLAMGFSAPLRQFVWIAFGTVAFWFFVWLFMLAAAGLGIVLFVDDARFDEVMELASTVAAWIATVLVGACVVIAAIAIASDKGGALLERFRPKGR